MMGLVGRPAAAFRLWLVAAAAPFPSLFSPSDLCSFVAFVLLYIVVLFLQRNTQDAFGVETSILDSVFDMVSWVALGWLCSRPSLTHALSCRQPSRTVDQAEGRVVRKMESVSHVYSWLETNIVQPIFTDPACGDGVCSSPQVQLPCAACTVQKQSY